MSRKEDLQEWASGRRPKADELQWLWSDYVQDETTGSTLPLPVGQDASYRLTVANVTYEAVRPYRVLDAPTIMLQA